MQVTQKTSAKVRNIHDYFVILHSRLKKYMKFCLPRDGELVEPDIEIELDDYRSYHRDKRSSKDKAR